MDSENSLSCAKKGVIYAIQVSASYYQLRGGKYFGWAHHPRVGVSKVQT